MDRRIGLQRICLVLGLCLVLALVLLTGCGKYTDSKGVETERPAGLWYIAVDDAGHCWRPVVSTHASILGGTEIPCPWKAK